MHPLHIHSESTHIQSDSTPAAHSRGTRITKPARRHWWRAVATVATVAVYALLATPAFAQNGTVNGTVTNQVTSAPVTSGSVFYCTVQSCLSFSIGASGAYTGSLAPGTYWAFTSVSTSLGVVNEIFDDIGCLGSCSAADARLRGAAIVVSGGSTITRSFALGSGGSITGTVTNDGTGAPLQNVTVQVLARVAGSVTSAGSVQTNASGVYTVTGLPTGTFYASTSGAADAAHTNEIYNDILCPGTCSSTVTVASGSPIAVTQGAATSGINFALSPAGRVIGRVRNAATLTGIANVNVFAVARIGLTTTTFGSAVTDASGNYTMGRLPTGAYAIFTSTSAGINEVYNNVQCPTSCNSTEALTLAPPVAVTQGATTANIDFDLDPGGVISGTVTAAGTSAPLQGSVQVYRQSGTTVTLVQGATANSSGAYSVAGLTTGSYFVVVSSSGFMREVYNGVNCLSFCSTTEILSGTPVAVTNGVSTPNINIVLDSGASITGVISAASSPLAFVSATAYRSGSTAGINATTNSAGSYTFSGLSAGTYFVVTNTNGFANEVYNNVACPNGTCSAANAVALGTPIVVGAGAAVNGINFSLDTLSAVPGPPLGLSARMTASGLEVSWSEPTTGGVATSYIFEGGVSAGGTIASLPTPTTSILVPGVPPGTYYLRARGVNAVGTGPASTEIRVVVGGGGIIAPQAPVSLQAWMAGSRLTVTWSDPSNGPTPTGYAIEAGTAVGTSNIAVIASAGRAFTFTPVPDGFYFLRVRALVGTAASAPTTDTMIVVGGVAAPPTPPQSLTSSVSGNVVTLTWTAPALGVPTAYILEAGSATGLTDITTLNTGSTATTFTTAGVPAGTYYVRLRATNALGTSDVSNERILVVP